MPTAEVNGVRLAYDDEGSGPPVVLVHGSWTNRHGWDRVAPLLAERFRVVRHDRRGHSESQDVPGTFDDDAADIAALAQHLELGPFHLACSSQGGAIGLRLAVSRPELIRSIVCHEPPIPDVIPASAPERREIDEVEGPASRVIELIDAGDHVAAARLFVEEVAFGPGTWDRLPPAMREMFLENAGTFADESRDPTGHGVDLDALRSMDRPVLLTMSAGSPKWLRLVVPALAELLPRAEVQVYEEGGHNPHGNVPEEYARVVGGFFERSD